VDIQPSTPQPVAVPVDSRAVVSRPVAVPAGSRTAASRPVAVPVDSRTAASQPAGVPPLGSPPAGTAVEPAGGPAPIPVPGPTVVQGRAARGRRRAVVLAVGALACLLVVVALVAVLSRDTGTRKPTSGGSARATPSRAASTAAGSAAASTAASPSVAPPSPTPPAPTAGFALPAGWTMRDDGTGFHVPVPDGWVFGRDDEGRALWHSPDGARLLLIDQTRHPKSDPVQDWRNNENARRSGYADYHRVRLEAVDYWDKAADWEFTYVRNGTTLHVLNRGFVTAPDQAYSIYFSTPDAQWGAAGPQLTTIVAGFQPARS
jgi:hypothetical protein